MFIQHILNIFKNIWLDKQYPNSTHLCYLKIVLISIGVWSDDASILDFNKNKTKGTNNYRIYHFIIFIFLSLFIGTVISDAFTIEVYSSFILLGDDLCLLTGILLIIFKLFYFSFYQCEIQLLLKEIEVHYYNEIKSNELHIKNIQRFYYLQEYFLFIGHLCNAIILLLAYVIQPLFNDNNILPIRAEFPFNTSENSIGYSIAYIFQTITLIYVIGGILIMDTLCGVIINETCLQFELLSYDFKKLGQNNGNNLSNINFNVSVKKDMYCLIEKHQCTIRLIDHINKLFQPTFLAQVIASMSMICLTAFEATLTLQNKSTFIKFAVYMFAAFGQLLYFCWLGNKLSNLSSKLHTSAYFCNWVEMEPNNRKYILFIIKRSQKPVVLYAKPLYALNFESFISILSGSYSYFTLLRTLNANE